MSDSRSSLRCCLLITFVGDLMGYAVGVAHAESYRHGPTSSFGALVSDGFVGTLFLTVSAISLLGTGAIFLMFARPVVRCLLCFALGFGFSACIWHIVATRLAI